VSKKMAEKMDEVIWGFRNREKKKKKTIFFGFFLKKTGSARN
jgi:hypothetical protein